MDLALTAEQALLQETFAAFFAKESASDVIRECEPLGFDPRLWRRVVETGAVAMGLPEAHGGGGAGRLDLVLVAEAFGRSLAPVPLVETVVAARLLAALDARDALARVVDGTDLVTFALRPATRGIARLVPGGAVSHRVLALDETDLVLTGRCEPEVIVSPRNLGSSPVADRDVRGEGRAVLATGSEAVRLHESTTREWKLIMAAALVGVAAGALDLTTEYVKTREQFGVPIGSFQAIQHRLADVATAVDGARLLVREAGWAADERLEVAPTLASMAYAYAAEIAAEATAAGLHFHGGYGFMLEYDIQLHFRRAKAWALVGGNPKLEYTRVAAELFGHRAERA